MRSYMLQIGRRRFGNKNSNNPTPPNIQFSISSYQNASASIPGFIRLYNAPPEMYINAKSLINTSFLFFAGWQTTPIINRVNYKEVASDLLVYGNLSGVLGNYTGKNPFIDLYFEPRTPKQIREQKEKTRKQTEQYKIQIQGLSPVILPIMNILKKLTSYNIIADPILYSVINPSKQTIFWACRNLPELLNWIDKTWNIKSEIDNKKKSYKLFRADIKLPALSTPAIIDKSEFISQPEILNNAGSVSAVIRLRPDLTLGQLIKIGSGVLPSFASVADNIKFVDSLLTSEYNKLFQTGIYTITAVHHLGEFYNPAPEGWSTQIELTMLSGSNLF